MTGNKVTYVDDALNDKGIDVSPAKPMPVTDALLSKTAFFSPGVANSIQTAGLITAEDSFAFGYLGIYFGILFSRGGKAEAQELTLTTQVVQTSSALMVGSAAWQEDL